jgi:predicted permease
MIEILTLVMPFFGLVFLGFICGKTFGGSLEGLAWINVFLIYLAIPALVFTIILRTPLEDLTNFRFIFATTSSTAFIFLATIGISIFFAKTKLPDATIQGFAAAYGNIGYLGPGIVIGALGTAAGAPVALIFCMDNALHFIMAPLMMALAGKDTSSILKTILKTIKNILLHPFIIATILAILVVVYQIELPKAIGTMTDHLYKAAAPVALFAVGITMALRPVKKVTAELPLLIIAKLILHPLCIWVVLTLVGNFNPIWISAAMMLAALPSAANVFVIAQQYSVWQERAASMVVLTTLISILTIPLWLWLIKHGFIPL